MSTPTRQDDQAPVVLTTRQVAEAWGKAISTIIRWAEQGRLPYITKLEGRTGGYVFPAEALPNGRTEP